MRDLALMVNGQSRSLRAKDNLLLLDLLRDGLEVRSVKAACWRGECGLCTVLLNGSLVKSCLVLAAEANGGEVTTVEGISEGEKLTPIQEAFVEHGATQCGFCTPAWVLTTHELLKANPNPSEKEVEEAVGGLLCRCGTYNEIREAVADASKAYAKARKSIVQRAR
ncbi:MAG: 2Fe-2S iron-sulfur cluster-binding protein [Thaumarchaeota archaeon]|nr:2Fe-2S iron-sulfur cluster-binding protein [Nitrososphaerota archaeon]